MKPGSSARATATVVHVAAVWRQLSKSGDGDGEGGPAR